MPIVIVDNFDVNVGKNVDSRYGPYNTVGDANTAISSAFRYKGLTVLITGSGQNIEYWYNPTTADGHLVPKTASTSVAGTDKQVVFYSGSAAISGSPSFSFDYGNSHLFVTGSTTLSGSVYVVGATTESQNNVVTINSVTGKLHYTASNALSAVSTPLDVKKDTTTIKSGPTFLNFTGSGVTVTANGAGVDIEIPGGSTTTPGGSDTQIQFNSGGLALSGSPNFTFDYNTNIVDINGSLDVSNTLPSLLVTESNGKPAVKLGDYTTAGNSTRIEIDDDSSTLSINSGGNLNIVGGEVGITTNTLKINTLTESPETKVVVWNSTSKQVYYTASSALGGGGSGTPGGSNKQVQFNANGTSFSGSSNFTFDSASNLVEITGSLTVSGSGTFKNIGPAIFSGSVVSTEGFTGSLQGTASWASNALSASVVEITNDTIPSSSPRYLTYVQNIGNSSQPLRVTSSLAYNQVTNTIFATASQAATASYHTGFNSTSSIIGDGALYSFDIAHNFGTRNVHVTVYGNSGNYETVYVDVRRPSINTVRVVFGGTTPPSSEAFVVYISQ